MTQCEECGEEIDVRRMKVIPATKVCVSCQQDLESNGHFRLHKLDVQAKIRCGEVDVTIQTLVRGN